MPDQRSQKRPIGSPKSDRESDPTRPDELRQRMRSNVQRLRALLGETPDGAEACDALESALRQIETREERLIDALDEEVARRGQAEEFRSFAYESSPFTMAIATLDDGRFLDINDTFTMRTGYARHEVIGRTSNELNLWLEGESREQFAEALRRDGEVDGLEIRVRLKSGEVMHARFFARVVTLGGKRCILSITQNIEERRRAEQEAIRLRAFYEELLALLPAHVALVDSNGRYEYISPSILPDADVRVSFIGRTMADLCDYLGIGAAVADWRLQWVAHVAAQNEVMQFEEHFASDTGEVEHWIRTHRPITNERGDVTGVLIYSLDVTELRRLEEQLSQSQKMEAVGRLAGGVAHDFNNLLTAIMGTADLLGGLCEDSAAVREGANEIVRIAERGASLTRQLLAFSRRQVANRTLFNLNQVIGGMQEMLHRLIGEHITLNVELSPGLPDIYADVSQLEQVILNLVINARDAMPDGGTLSIQTAAADGPFHDADALAPLSTLPHIVLNVSDTGAGMTPDICAKAFEPFFTTKEEGKGTGLGLSTVYAIVQGCHGDVTVESSEGQGSSFTLRIPAAKLAERETATPSGSPISVTGTGTILVVEDEDAVRTIVDRVLRRGGYTVLSAANGQEALRIVDEQSANIDLVLTDMIMPGLSGRHLAERVLESHPSMRILFMSGHIEDGDSRSIVEQFGNRFIQKPFTPDVPARSRRRHLERRVTFRGNPDTTKTIAGRSACGAEPARRHREQHGQIPGEQQEKKRTFGPADLPVTHHDGHAGDAQADHDGRVEPQDLGAHVLAFHHAGDPEDTEHVEDIRSENIADRDVGLFSQRRHERRDEFGRRGAGADNGQRNDQLRNAQHPRDTDGGIDEQVRSAHQHGQSYDDQRQGNGKAHQWTGRGSAQLIGNFFAGTVTFRTGLAIPPYEEGDETGRHESPFEAGHFGAGEYGDKRDKRRGNDEPDFTANDRGVYGDRRDQSGDAENNGDVKNVAADDVADVDIGIALERGGDPGGQFRRAGSEPDDGQPNEERRDPHPAGQPRGPAHQGLRAQRQDYQRTHKPNQRQRHRQTFLRPRRFLPSGVPGRVVAQV